MIKAIIFDFNRTIYDPHDDNPDADRAGRLTEGCKELLDALQNRGIQLCLLTRKDDKGDREKLICEELGLRKYFADKIVIIDEEEKNEGHFKECLNLMSLDDPSEVAVVGDRVEEEIRIGNKMGMMTIWYRAGKFSDVLPKNDSQEPCETITELQGVLLHVA